MRKVIFLWSQFITFFWNSAPQNTFSSDYTKFLDSIDSTESTDVIDSIDSILVPHKETASIHTTHKVARANKSTDGGGAPIGTFVLPVCGV